MMKAKKGRMMRHPYATLAVFGLAATGAISITQKVKGFFKDKTTCVSNMVKGMKPEGEN